jgi:hypothetical protein
MRYGGSGEVVERFKNKQLLFKIFTDVNRALRVRVKYSPEGIPIEAWDWRASKTFQGDVQKTIFQQGWLALD